MRKSDIAVLPDHFSKYIALVPDVPLTEALEAFADPGTMVSGEELKALGDLVYAPGKWTVREILQHVIDTERVFSYRALRFSRNDQTPLQGFDEEWFARFTTAGSRAVDDLVAELKVVRESTGYLYRNCTAEMLLRTGIASGTGLSVLAMGFTTAGHLIHHMNIIRERYLPLLGAR